MAPSTLFHIAPPLHELQAVLVPGAQVPEHHNTGRHGRLTLHNLSVPPSDSTQMKLQKGLTQAKAIGESGFHPRVSKRFSEWSATSAAAMPWRDLSRTTAFLGPAVNAALAQCLTSKIVAC